MKGIILLNGEKPNFNIDVENSFVICCDGALRWAKELKIKVDIVLGDFDSLGYSPENAIKYPSEKNYTDGELAINKIINKNIDTLEIYGGGGGRDDHYFGNVNLLYKAFKNGIDAEFITNYSIMFFKNSSFKKKINRGTTVSLLPYNNDAHIYNSKGLKYPLVNLTLKQGETRGLSNLASEDEIELTFDKCDLLCFIVKSEL